MVQLAIEPLVADCGTSLSNTFRSDGMSFEQATTAINAIA